LDPLRLWRQVAPSTFNCFPPIVLEGPSGGLDPISNEPADVLLGLHGRLHMIEQCKTPVVMPRKKDIEGNWTETRICGDYRPHNKKTMPDKCPMPVADELFDDLGGANCFSTLDLRMGYHQIRIREGDQYKLAFRGHDDLYMPLRLPFSPKNGPAIFQRLMDDVLRHLREVAGVS
jgi:hypothetical protein